MQQRDGTPVISISWGETMWFWAQSDVREWVVTALEHGSVWVWSSKDDKSGVKHAVHFPPMNECSGEKCAGRWVLVGRWLDTVRQHSQEYPHYNVSGRAPVWL